MTNAFFRRAVVLLLAAGVGYGQGVALPSFEVASVKPAQPVQSTSTADFWTRVANAVRIDPAQVRLTNRALDDLISLAYGVKSFQISAPEWIYNAHYDIAAKIPAGVATDLVPEMLQSLLENRMKLKFHRASKELDVFVLSVREGGLKIPQKPADYKFSGAAASWPQTMESLTTMLQDGLGRPVVDKTGLQGAYMVPRSLGDLVRKAAVGRLFPGSAAENATETPSAGDIRLSVRALGLSVDPGKQSFLLLVVDSAEKVPTEN